VSSPDRSPQPYESYEAVANFLLNEIAAELELQRVEGKQDLVGMRSGTTWTVDGMGVKGQAGEAFVIIECRRYTTSKMKQEHLGALAYRIIDTGAASGIIVTPSGLQTGAQKVAEAENIIPVHLDENSTRDEYLLSFLNRIYSGVSDVAIASDQVTAVLTLGDENSPESRA
jgi:restriction endonuclease